MRCILSAMTLLLSISVLGACASSDVTGRQAYSEQEKIARPGRVIVYDFAATPTDIPPSAGITGHYSVRQTPQTSKEIQLGRQLGAQVSNKLVREILDMGMPAQRAGKGPPPRIGDILITGQFISIDEGSRTKRVIIGFGKGGGELRTHVQGYLVTRSGHRLLGSREIATAGGKKPGMLVPAIGAIAMANPVGLIVGGAINLHKESGPETIKAAASRTAEEIAKELKTAFRRRGWI
jgi:Domain of unknown function (DUF4410)